MGLANKRNILLLEPNYRNKYPPIGLMKISTYHKMIGDNVTFFKGDVNDLIVNELCDKAIQELQQSYLKIDWYELRGKISNYIKKRQASNYLLDNGLADYAEVLDKFAGIYRSKDYVNFPKWDRIYVTTLFTFYWKLTIDAIHKAKNLVNNLSELMIGGVLASLLKNELYVETGILPMEGLLDKPNILDPELPLASGIVIDDLPLDYSILDEIDYKYPTGSAYFTFMTKGCTRKCKFCSVPILEPTYKPKIATKDKFFAIKERFGEQQHLLLMDNNVLASPNFPEIIQEIKDMGFVKGATFEEPNQLEIAIKNLETGYNDRAYLRKATDLIFKLIPRLKGEVREKYEEILKSNGLTNSYRNKKTDIINTFNLIRDIYESKRLKSKKVRYVDFNQGTDARYVTDDLMKLMSEIPIRPLRVAFDYWGMKEQYEAAVRLAAKYGIREMSNYILYNFNDSPEELYKRLQINVALNVELDMKIYSFPMKYIPLFGEEAKSREHLGKKWNRKYIRAIQSILNVTRGIVAPGAQFFEMAFGKDLNDFLLLLEMPEDYIIYRNYFELVGLTNQWKKEFLSLSDAEKLELFSIIHANNFKKSNVYVTTPKVQNILKHYSIKKSDGNREEYLAMKKEYNKLIKSDSFINLTLTYDFEPEVVKRGLKKVV